MPLFPVQRQIEGNAFTSGPKLDWGNACTSGPKLDWGNACTFGPKLDWGNACTFGPKQEWGKCIYLTLILIMVIIILLVSKLMFGAHSTTRNYIRAEEEKEEEKIGISIALWHWLHKQPRGASFPSKARLKEMHLLPAKSQAKENAFTSGQKPEALLQKQAWSLLSFLKNYLLSQVDRRKTAGIKGHKLVGGLTRFGWLDLAVVLYVFGNETMLSPGRVICREICGQSTSFLHFSSCRQPALHWLVITIGLSQPVDSKVVWAWRLFD